MPTCVLAEKDRWYGLISSRWADTELSSPLENCPINAFSSRDVRDTNSFLCLLLTHKPPWAQTPSLSEAQVFSTLYLVSLLWSHFGDK